mgnify:FL=1
MKNLILIIATLCFAQVAEAKVTYNNKTMVTGHLNTIKGLLYEKARTEIPKNKKSTSVLFSKSIVWLTNCHKSNKVFKLESYNTKEAILIKKTIAVIFNVVKGKYPGLPIAKTLNYWTKIGSRVLAEYNKKPNNAVVVWKLKLKPKQPKTQNLVLRHPLNKIKIVPQ